MKFLMIVFVVIVIFLLSKFNITNTEWNWIYAALLIVVPFVGQYIITYVEKIRNRKYVNMGRIMMVVLCIIFGAALFSTSDTYIHFIDHKDDVEINQKLVLMQTHNTDKIKTIINIGRNDNINFSDLSNNKTDVVSNVDEHQTSTESEISSESVAETQSETQNNESETTSTTEEIIPEITASQTIETTSAPEQPEEGFWYGEAYKMMDCINQYRLNAGLSPLSWDDDLTYVAQDIAHEWAYKDANQIISISSQDFTPVARRTMGPITTTAEVAVSAWITGNNDIRSRVDDLLNANYTTMGGAVYYRPDDFSVFHYFWVVLLK